MIRTATLPANAAGVSTIVVALAVEMDIYDDEERLFLDGKDSSKAHNTFWQVGKMMFTILFFLQMSRMSPFSK
jgi:hypothetical protein